MHNSHCGCIAEGALKYRHMMGPGRSTQRFQLSSILAPVSMALLVGLAHTEGRFGPGLIVGKYGA